MSPDEAIASGKEETTLSLECQVGGDSKVQRCQSVSDIQGMDHPLADYFSLGLYRAQSTATDNSFSAKLC